MLGRRLPPSLCARCAWAINAARCHFVPSAAGSCGRLCYPENDFTLLRRRGEQRCPIRFCWVRSRRAEPKWFVQRAMRTGRLSSAGALTPPRPRRPCARAQSGLPIGESKRSVWVPLARQQSIRPLRVLARFSRRPSSPGATLTCWVRSSRALIFPWGTTPTSTSPAWVRSPSVVPRALRTCSTSPSAPAWVRA